MLARLVSLFDQAVTSEPVGTILVLGILAVIVAVAAGFAIDALLPEPGGALDPHPYNANDPAHCDACWMEASRRHQQSRAAAFEFVADENRRRARAAIEHYRQERAAPVRPSLKVVPR